MQGYRHILPAGANPATYPADELERERAAITRHRVRWGRVSRKLHQSILRGRPQLRKARLQALRHLAHTGNTPARLSVALMRPDQAGITERRERDMLRRAYSMLSTLG